MSLFGRLGLMGGAFDEDPFASTRNIFHQMDRMMGSMMHPAAAPLGFSGAPLANDPFFRSASIPSLLGGDAHPLALTPFGNTLMPSVVSTPDAMGGGGGGGCHVFSSSSVVTMTTGPDGRPQVYQASASSRSGPGGVRETRRSVADSRSGVRKMAIGHHIEDKSHVIEKEVDGRGQLEERQEFVNLEEEEAAEFDKEFKRRVNHHGYQGAYPGGGALEARHRPHRGGDRQRNTYLPALPASSRSVVDTRRRARPMLAIASGNSRSENRARHRERGAGRSRH